MALSGNRLHGVLALALTLAVACTLVVPRVAHAQSLERIKQRGNVTMGYRDDAVPFSLKDKSGNPTGYAVEICQAIAADLAQAAGLPATALRYLAIPMDQMERYVKAANVDLFCSATSDTPERRRSMQFSPPIFFAAAKVLVRKRDNVHTVADLGGKSLVVIDKTTAVNALAAYASKAGLAVSTAKAVGADAALGQLRLGWVAGSVRDDVLLASQLAIAQDGADYTILPEALSSESIAIAFPAGDPAMDKLVAHSLAEMHKRGALLAAYDRWFMKPLPSTNRALNLPISDALKASWDALK